MEVLFMYVAAVLLPLFVNMGGWFRDILVEFLFRGLIHVIKLLPSRGWAVIKNSRDFLGVQTAENSP
jgi:hypothetical protein